MASSAFVIVPARNEASVIEATLAPLIEGGYEVVVVDDGSTDDTYARVTRLPVHLLRHPINLGQGAALQTGMDYALARGAEVIVHFDADGQHPPESLPDLLAPIEAGAADVVLGSRFLTGAAGAGVPLRRRMVLRAARLLTGLTTGVWLTDAHNGLRALSAEAARRIRFTEDGMAHASEIVALMRKHGLRYIEVPTRVRYTTYSVKKGQPLLNGLNILMDLLLRRVFAR